MKKSIKKKILNPTTRVWGNGFFFCLLRLNRGSNEVLYQSSVASNPADRIGRAARVVWHHHTHERRG